jgi:hypothetical protein
VHSAPAARAPHILAFSESAHAALSDSERAHAARKGEATETRNDWQSTAEVSMGLLLLRDSSKPGSWDRRALFGMLPSVLQPPPPPPAPCLRPCVSTRLPHQCVAEFLGTALIVMVRLICCPGLSEPICTGMRRNLPVRSSLSHI